MTKKLWRCVAIAVGGMVATVACGFPDVGFYGTDVPMDAGATSIDSGGLDRAMGSGPGKGLAPSTGEVADGADANGEGGTIDAGQPMNPGDASHVEGGSSGGIVGDASSTEAGTSSGSSTDGGTDSGTDGDAHCSLTVVNLLSAASFAVLAGSTITNTGQTTVTGDLGVSPGTAVTGFPPGTITGAEHADAVAAQAEADLTTAYNDAAGRTQCPISVAGNLGAQTLSPGLYKSTSSLEVSSGDLTLDAMGDSGAIWIFQMATTLTMTAGRQVVLAGGAQAKNIFWQVGSSATLGKTSTFQGTIMADQAITMATGATLNGRVLAHTAAVTLDSNMIVRP
jgi:hypothetical protein